MIFVFFFLWKGGGGKSVISKRRIGHAVVATFSVPLGNLLSSCRHRWDSFASPQVVVGQASLEDPPTASVATDEGNTAVDQTATEGSPVVSAALSSTLDSVPESAEASFVAKEMESVAEAPKEVASEEANVNASPG